MKKIIPPVRMESRVNLISSIISPLDREDGNTFVFNITSSSKDVKGVPFAQSVLNFINTYSRIFDIEVTNLFIDPEFSQDSFNLYMENSESNYSYAQIEFRAKSIISSFAGPIVETSYNYEHEETYDMNSFNENLFHIYLLNCMTGFIHYCNDRFLKNIGNPCLYYPCKYAEIRGVYGYIIESLVKDTREDMLYQMSKLKSEKKIRVYGLRHNGDCTKPSVIEENVVSNRYGWFVTDYKSKNILSDKKKSYKLSKKNYKPMTEEDSNVFDFFSNYDNDEE